LFPITFYYVQNYYGVMMTIMGVDPRVDRGTCPPYFLKWMGRLVFCPPHFFGVDIFNALFIA